MQTQSRRGAWVAVSWRVLVFVVGAMLVYAPLDIQVRSAARSAGTPLSPVIRLALEAAALICLWLVAWLLARLDRQPLLPTLGLERTRAVPETLLGVCGGTAWTGSTLLLLAAAGALHLNTFAAPAWTPLAIVGLSTLVNAAMQEVLFRGYPFHTIASRSSVSHALAVTTALFVLLHLGAAKDSPLGLVNLAAAGLLFGVVRARSGRLWAPIGLHFAWNFLVGPLFGLSVSGSEALSAGSGLLTLTGPNWLTGGAFGIEASLATSVTAIAALGMYRWIAGRRMNLAGSL